MFANKLLLFFFHLFLADLFIAIDQAVDAHPLFPVVAFARSKHLYLKIIIISVCLIRISQIRAAQTSRIPG
jgi:hypothetical protein